MVVVLASKGYPEKYPTGELISVPSKIPENSQLIHAGTKLNSDNLNITCGGRVLGAVGLGNDLSQAKNNAYKLCEMVDFTSKYFRKDIGHKEFSRN